MLFVFNIVIFNHIKGNCVFGLKKKSEPILGIDISLTSVKLLELSKGGSQYRVESYAVEALPANAVVERNIADPELVGDTIAKVVKKSGTRVKRAAVAVSGAAVITKVIAMPADIPEPDMQSQIELEADQYIPFPLDEVSMDFEILGVNAENDEQVDVLLAASKSDNINTRVEALEIGGLEAKIVDIEAFALENSISLIAQEILGGSDGKVIAIADVGSAFTTLSVFENSKTIYSREQAFGGSQLTEDIQRRYGLSYEEAGLAKKQGGLPSNYEPEVLQPFMESMAQQINRAQQFFFSSSEIDHIDYLLLSGGCASIAGIAGVIEAEVGVSTQVANPFASMSVASGVSSKLLSNDAPSLMLACGLALRSVS